MADRLVLTEHELHLASSGEAGEIQDAIENLRSSLKPRITQFFRHHRGVEVKNLVGSVRMASGRILEVRPKIVVTQDWTSALVQLLDGSSRISVTGSQRTRESAKRQDLTTAIALEYARRLESALASDGPVQVFQRHSLVSRRLNGHLNVSRWVRQAPLDPTKFPVERDDLTVANDFARGLSLVCGYFRRSSSDAKLTARLRRLEAAVLPGTALPSYVNPAVANRRLPLQWGRYRPAWDIAAAMLRNRSVVGDPGYSTGLEVAVEPWPLLETLLERTLQALAKNPDLGLGIPVKTTYPLLRRNGRAVGRVEPDGLLTRGGHAVATFEAKYTNPPDVPYEDHRYQALSTAAALHSPLAIIVYPGSQSARVFDVEGFGGWPEKLITVGLDMYNYDRDSGDEQRADKIRHLLHEHGVLREPSAFASESASAANVDVFTWR